jgi:hypothetical protein
MLSFRQRWQGGFPPTMFALHDRRNGPAYFIASMPKVCTFAIRSNLNSTTNICRNNIRNISHITSLALFVSHEKCYLLYLFNEKNVLIIINDLTTCVPRG